MPESEPSLFAWSAKERKGILGLRNPTKQVNPTQGRGCKTWNMVRHPVRRTRSQATQRRGAEAHREYEAKICNRPTRPWARRRYRASMEFVAEPDAVSWCTEQTGTGSPIPGSRSTHWEHIAFFFILYGFSSLTFDFSFLFYTYAFFYFKNLILPYLHSCTLSSQLINYNLYLVGKGS